jgi:hypothetical protein
MLIFDSDSPTSATTPRVFTVTNLSPVLLTAAGLTAGACIPLFVRGGQVASLEPGCAATGGDFLWAPLSRCGVAVQLCAEANQLVELVPGTYSLGDPTAPLVVPGNVNVQLTRLDDMAPEVLCCLGKCEAPPSPPSPLLPVETAMAELGCISDLNGAQIGKVLLVRTVDENTGAVVTAQNAYYEDGTVVVGYTGPWSVCSPDICQPLATRGLQSGW